MALVKCKECGKEISDKAEVCIHCGMEQNVKTKEERFSTNQISKEQGWFAWFISNNIVPILVIGMGIFLFIMGQQSYWYNDYDTYVYPRQKYINGDAYNYMIEASIMSGEISGSRSANATAELQEAVYVCSSFIIVSIGLTKMRFKRG